MSPIECLPREVLSKVLSHLDLKNLGRKECLSKLFQEITREAFAIRAHKKLSLIAQDLPDKILVRVTPCIETIMKGKRVDYTMNGIGGKAKITLHRVAKGQHLKIWTQNTATLQEATTEWLCKDKRVIGVTQKGVALTLANPEGQIESLASIIKVIFNP